MSRTQLVGWRLGLARISLLAVVLGISILLFSLRDQSRQLAAYGYPGVFVLSMLSNATLVLPLPTLAIPFAAGAILNPVGVALAAGAGAAFGELTGYMAGFSGQGLLERSSVYNRLKGWTERYGGWMILIIAFVPTPLFDLAGAAAGALRMNIWRFFFWTLIGKTFRMLVVAYAGAASIDWVLNLMQPFEP